MAIDYQSQVVGAKWYGLAAVIAAPVFLVVPNAVVKALAFLIIAGPGSRAAFHVATLISIRLSGTARRAFQVAIAIIVPMVLSIYFIKDAEQITLHGVAGNVLTPWFLVPLAIVSAFGWAGAEILDNEHPFRGYLIGVGVLFVLTWMAHNGMSFSSNDYGENGGGPYFGREAVAIAARTGRFFGQFIVYTCAMYLAMAIKRWRYS